jgi:uncharacterized membrane protein
MTKDNKKDQINSANQDYTPDSDNSEEVEIGTIVSMIQKVSGPYPLPEMLKGYKDVGPEVLERVLALVEATQKQTHKIEQKMLEADIKKVSTGQRFAFIITMTGLIGGVFCATYGATEIGMALVGGGLVPVISQFIYKKKSKELKPKSNE